MRYQFLEVGQHFDARYAHEGSKSLRPLHKVSVILAAFFSMPQTKSENSQFRGNIGFNLEKHKFRESALVSNLFAAGASR